MRPRIICHMITSIDGRIISNRWTPPAKGEFSKLLGHYETAAVHFKSDAWLVGRKTMGFYATHPARPVESPTRLPRKTYIADATAKSFAVVVDPQGKLHYGKGTLEGSHVIAILSTKVSDDYLAELQMDGVSYLFAGAKGSDMKHAMETLRKDFNVRTLMLEGGGITNGLFLKQKLIDEISLLIYPGIDGLSGVSNVFDCPGSEKSSPAKGLSLMLKATKPLSGGVVWLRYKVVSPSRSGTVT